WGPRAIGDHGAPVSLSKLKKAYERVCTFHTYRIPVEAENCCSSCCYSSDPHSLWGPIRGGLTTHGAPGQ
ncbi:unnamed protein product, partial [Staurois parvus]